MRGAPQAEDHHSRSAGCIRNLRIPASWSGRFVRVRPRPPGPSTEPAGPPGAYFSPPSRNPHTSVTSRSAQAWQVLSHSSGSFAVGLGILIVGPLGWAGVVGV